jgi:hypothetical protein
LQHSTKVSDPESRIGTGQREERQNIERAKRPREKTGVVACVRESREIMSKAHCLRIFSEANKGLQERDERI